MSNNNSLSPAVLVQFHRLWVKRIFELQANFFLVIGTSVSTNDVDFSPGYSLSTTYESITY